MFIKYITVKSHEKILYEKIILHRGQSLSSKFVDEASVENEDL